MQRRRLQSINEQLNIGVPNNPNIPSRYTRGLLSIQPQLGTEDWSLDFYNDIASLKNMSNADGYSNALGYGIFCGKKCAAAKAAQGIPPKNGKKNKERWAAEQAQKAAGEAKNGSAGKSSGSGSAKMSTGAKVGIAIGAVVVLGLVGFLILRKR